MKLIKKFLMGGQVAPEQVEEQNMPVEQAPEASADPIEQIIDVIAQLSEAGAQALESQDPQALAQVVQALVQFGADIQAQIGGGPQEQPVFKKGGVIVRKKKMKCGGKTKK